MNHLRAELLPNGLVRVFNCQTSSATCYKAGTLKHHSGVDRREYREAAKALIGV